VEEAEEMFKALDTGAVDDDETTDSRPCDPAEEETALERTGGSTALGGVDDAQQQREGRDREHRRSKATDTPEEEKLMERLREPCRSTRDGDDAQPAREDDPLAPAIDHDPGNR
jgi:hypothetical protein